MKSSHKGFAQGLLYALNIFIVFLLIFGNKIIIPQWLQPVGRLHPLILHFPIVILMLAMVLEFFRFRTEFSSEKMYQNFATFLLLLGAILSAITVIMGLFLSKEPGYEGSVLQWHKWTGVSIVFIVTAIYWFRSAEWYRAPVAKSGAVATVFFLILAGHFGADLTHGENFILAPVMHKTAVPIDQALVYEDVIKPIFATKCVSCHNEDKLKGRLLLSDPQGILKGGKTGKLFIPGKPEMSLLLQRVHLPVDDKKHMPPSGKTQLTPEESMLLYLWVKSNPNFKKKVIELPANDSLRVLASTLLQPAEKTEEKFDFAAADDKTIKKLNNNYRVVYAIAKESPALAVNVYNKSVYTPKVLEELTAVKKQIISLNLSKMPVKDAELKTIGQFENLRVLNLNFTDITGSGLKELAGLKHLKTLSLAGTKLDPQAFKQVGAIKSLRELAIWNTGLKEPEIQQLQKANKNITFIEGYKDDGKPIKLNPVQLKNDFAVFNKPFPLLLSHSIKGVDIRYTMDGTDPDSVKSPVYKPGLIIDKNTVIKVRACKTGWYCSDIGTYTFYKSSFKPDSLILLAPMGKNTSEGPKTLIDGQLSLVNANAISFEKNDMIALCEYKQPVKASMVTLHASAYPEFGLMYPSEMEVWGGMDKDHLTLLTKVKPVQAGRTGKLTSYFIDCKFKSKNVAVLKIIAKMTGFSMSFDEVLIN